MEKEEFNNLLDKYLNETSLKFNEKKKEQLYLYMNLLIEWNEKINLTAITKPEEIILKHFIDSITISKYIKSGSYICDIGTGAGFPGIPLKILRDDITVILVDSLNKRIKFLDEVIEKLDLKNIQTIHARAEEFGQNKKYREKFDIATSRAVANLATLSEYLLPLVKVNGRAICMKGPGATEEISGAKNAIKLLGGKIQNIYEFELPHSDIERCVIEITKEKNIQSKYPRKAGTPAKDPLK